MTSTQFWFQLIPSGILFLPIFNYYAQQVNDKLNTFQIHFHEISVCMKTSNMFVHMSQSGLFELFNFILRKSNSSMRNFITRCLSQHAVIIFV